MNNNLCKYIASLTTVIAITLSTQVSANNGNTLNLRAENLAFVPSGQSMRQIVSDGVQICYDAYKPFVIQAVDQQRSESLMISGGMNNNYALLIPIGGAKALAEAIINQMSALVPQISIADRSEFWDLTSAQIKTIVPNLLKELNCNSKGDFDSHVDNMIRLKKAFG